MLNYAKLISDRSVIVFFENGDVPSALLEQPKLWASWFFAVLDMHIIGEAGNEYCFRLAHAPRHPHCDSCRPRRVSSANQESVSHGL